MTEHSFRKEETANKRLAKNTIVLYIRMLFAMGLSLYTSRIVLAELGVTDYGIYNVVGSIVTFFTFISHALSNSTNRFIVFSIGEGDYRKTQKIYNTCYRIHLIIAIIVAILIETFGLWFLNGRLNIPEDRLQAAYWVFHFSTAICFLTILRVPTNAEVIAHEEMGIYALISISESVLRLVVAVALIYSPFDKLIYYALLLLLVQLAGNIAYHVYCRFKYVECKLSFLIKNEKSLYKEIGSFAGWSMLGNVVWMGYTQGINLMLNIFFGPVVNAARGVAVQVESAVLSFVKSFQTALNPQIIKSYAQNDLSRMHELVIYSSKISIFLYFLFAIPIFFEADNILGIWLVEVPEHSVNFVRLTLLVLIFNTLANPLGTSNDATGNIKSFQIVCSLINLQIITISYLFLKAGSPPEVVFVVHTIVLSLQTLVKLFFVRRQIGLSIRYYMKNVGISTVCVLCSSSAISYLIINKFKDDFISVLLFCILSALIVTVAMYIFGLSRLERVKVHGIVKQYIGLRKR